MSSKAHACLPLDIIGIIAKELAFDHPPGLFNLARANKACHDFCRPLLKSLPFHDIMLRVPSWVSSKNLEQPVENLIKKFKDTDGLGYVRQIFICQEENPYRKPEQWTPPRLSDLRCERLPDTYTTQYASWRDFPAPTDMPNWLNNWLNIPFDSASERSWRPVLNLIMLLPGLTDLVWEFPEEFPFSVLQTLHKDRPKCRFHLHSFWLHRLLDPKAKTWEQELFTSPSLYSIKLTEQGDSTTNGPRHAGTKPGGGPFKWFYVWRSYIQWT